MPRYDAWKAEVMEGLKAQNEEDALAWEFVGNPQDRDQTQYKAHNNEHLLYIKMYSAQIKRISPNPPKG